ncbi:HigA family addiction module antitoxin [Methylomonas sp. SURF-2]|uniref:HigA family addiction module antitoxin n=1 Tax=Methylomonas subterranea TaxID=2952225 RepID=A0ABT1THZ9_9GAMM|nr:HigA family addiction module antitoxin [Methylomonas sp. SURF-2]MCQ8105086.1 HigA family addiction module antitoxin [Methylomonas sp. SURF-2]
MAMLAPLHPGGILKNDVLPDLGLGVTEAAAQLGVSRETLSRVLNGRRAISADMAIRLETWIDGPTAETWLRLQAKYDIWVKRKEFKLSNRNCSMAGLGWRLCGAFCFSGVD